MAAALPFATGKGRMLIFTTAGQVDGIQQELPQVAWEGAHPIPWSREKVLLVGSFD
jgi:hypothetical protein